MTKETEKYISGRTLTRRGGKMDETLTKKELLRFLEKYNDDDKIYSFYDGTVYAIKEVNASDANIVYFERFIWPAEREKENFKEPVKKEDTIEKLITIND